MRVSRRFVIAYMALASILCAALLVVGVMLAPDPLESEDWFGLAY